MQLSRLPTQDLPSHRDDAAVRWPSTPAIAGPDAVVLLDDTVSSPRAVSRGYDTMEVYGNMPLSNSAGDPQPLAARQVHPWHLPESRRQQMLQAPPKPQRNRLTWLQPSDEQIQPPENGFVLQRQALSALLRHGTVAWQQLGPSTASHHRGTATQYHYDDGLGQEGGKYDDKSSEMLILDPKDGIERTLEWEGIVADAEAPRTAAAKAVESPLLTRDVGDCYGITDYIRCSGAARMPSEFNPSSTNVREHRLPTGIAPPPAPPLPVNGSSLPGSMRAEGDVDGSDLGVSFSTRLLPYTFKCSTEGSAAYWQDHQMHLEEPGLRQSYGSSDAPHANRIEWRGTKRRMESPPAKGRGTPHWRAFFPPEASPHPWPQHHPHHHPTERPVHQWTWRQPFAARAEMGTCHVGSQLEKRQLQQHEPWERAAASKTEPQPQPTPATTGQQRQPLRQRQWLLKQEDGAYLRESAYDATAIQPGMTTLVAAAADGAGGGGGAAAAADGGAASVLSSVEASDWPAERVRFTVVMLTPSQAPTKYWPEEKAEAPPVAVATSASQPVSPVARCNWTPVALCNLLPPKPPQAVPLPPQPPSSEPLPASIPPRLLVQSRPAAGSMPAQIASTNAACAGSNRGGTRGGGCGDGDGHGGVAQGKEPRWTAGKADIAPNIPRAPSGAGGVSVVLQASPRTHMGPTTGKYMMNTPVATAAATASAAEGADVRSKTQVQIDADLCVAAELLLLLKESGGVRAISGVGSQMAGGTGRKHPPGLPIGRAKGGREAHERKASDYGPVAADGDEATAGDSVGCPLRVDTVVQHVDAVCDTSEDMENVELTREGLLAAGPAACRLKPREVERAAGQVMTVAAGAGKLQIADDGTGGTAAVHCLSHGEYSRTSADDDGSWGHTLTVDRPWVPQEALQVHHHQHWGPPPHRQSSLAREHSHQPDLMLNEPPPKQQDQRMHRRLQHQQQPTHRCGKQQQALPPPLQEQHQQQRQAMRLNHTADGDEQEQHQHLQQSPSLVVSLDTREASDGTQLWEQRGAFGSFFHIPLENPMKLHRQAHHYHIPPHEQQRPWQPVHEAMEPWPPINPSPPPEAPNPAALHAQHRPATWPSPRAARDRQLPHLPFSSDVHSEGGPAGPTPSLEPRNPDVQLSDAYPRPLATEQHQQAEAQPLPYSRVLHFCARSGSQCDQLLPVKLERSEVWQAEEPVGHESRGGAILGSGIRWHATHSLHRCNTSSEGADEWTGAPPLPTALSGDLSRPQPEQQEQQREQYRKRIAKAGSREGQQIDWHPGRGYDEGEGMEVDARPPEQQQLLQRTHPERTQNFLMQMVQERSHLPPHHSHQPQQAQRQHKQLSSVIPSPAASSPILTETINSVGVVSSRVAARSSSTGHHQQPQQHGVSGGSSTRALLRSAAADASPVIGGKCFAGDCRSRGDAATEQAVAHGDKSFKAGSPLCPEWAEDFALQGTSAAEGAVAAGAPQSSCGGRAGGRVVATGVASAAVVGGARGFVTAEAATGEPFFLRPESRSPASGSCTQVTVRHPVATAPVTSVAPVAAAVAAHFQQDERQQQQRMIQIAATATVAQAAKSVPAAAASKGRSLPTPLHTIAAQAAVTDTAVTAHTAASRPRQPVREDSTKTPGRSRSQATAATAIGTGAGITPNTASGRGLGSVDISLEELRNTFELPAPQAARILGTSTTNLKRKCRMLGISRWPHRKLDSLHRLRNLVLSDSVYSDDCQTLLADITLNIQMILDDPNAGLVSTLKNLRQAYYKRGFDVRKLQVSRAAAGGGTADSDVSM